MSRQAQGRPDGSPGPELRRPWAKWHVEGFADKIAGVHVGIAILFAASALIGGSRMDQSGQPAFPLIAPLIAVLFFVAQVVMFTSRERHGLVRGILAIGSALLAITAAWFTGHVDAMRLFLSYWVPAVMGIFAATVLAWGKSTARQVEVDLSKMEHQPAGSGALRSESPLRSRGR